MESTHPREGRRRLGGRRADLAHVARGHHARHLLAGAPAINWTKFITAELYPQVVYQRDLAGVPLTPGQSTLLGNAAITACDAVGNRHLGYIPDPFQCRYDPTQDLDVICANSGGNAPAGDCVTQAQAVAMNKIWYGQTADGSVPSPSTDNGTALETQGAQRWYGLTRGTNIGGLGGPRPFTIASDIASPVTTANPNAASRPICMHPTKAVFVGSDPLVAASYNCT